MTRVLRRTQRDYSLVFKLSVVDQVEIGVMIYRQAQDKYYAMLPLSWNDPSSLLQAMQVGISTH